MCGSAVRNVWGGRGGEKGDMPQTQVGRPLWLKVQALELVQPNIKVSMCAHTLGLMAQGSHRGRHMGTVSKTGLCTWGYHTEMRGPSQPLPQGDVHECHSDTESYADAFASPSENTPRTQTARGTMCEILRDE